MSETNERGAHMRCEDVYRVFFKPGEVVELRALGVPRRTHDAWEGYAGGDGIVSGYFDNAEAFGKAAEALDKLKTRGIYFTLNPCIPSLLARAANRLKAAGGKQPTTSDHEIQCIRWLPVDLDPVRPAGISSTDAELESAWVVSQQVATWAMHELGMPEPIRAISGNGVHLVFGFRDMDNTPEHVAKVKQSIEAIAAKFTTKEVEVDRKVFNPARIWRLYGTTARKGDSIPDRPHRKSYIPRDDLVKLLSK